MAKLLKNMSSMMSDPTERMLKDIRRATWQSKDYVAENDLLLKPLKTIFKDNAKDRIFSVAQQTQANAIEARASAESLSAATTNTAPAAFATAPAPQTHDNGDTCVR